MRLDGEVLGLRNRLIQHRRYLHQYPETDFEVGKTRDYITEQIKKLGFGEIEILAQNGVKVVIRGNIPGRTLAFRADMDALPIEEETGVEFASLNKGVMHACGHDGHMTVLLGLAEWIAMHRENIKGNVVLIFQPAEETVGGALPMIKEGVLEEPEVDAIFGLHLLPDIPQGKVVMKPGVVMAQTCEFDVEITGKSAHGATPHFGIDALMASCDFVHMLQGVVSRRIPYDEKAVVTIGRMEAGEKRNIIAGKARLEGTIRTFDDKVYSKIKENIIKLLKSLELSHGIRGQYHEVVYYPAVNNDVQLTSKIAGFVDPDILVDIDPLMIAEDFSYFQQKVPGTYMFLGCRNEEKGFTAPLHSSLFNFDEEVLLLGLQIYVNILKNYS
ncbi:MAG: amidohydrolase [Clostridiales bacterium]|nr:amidohydrolase [Clostridiales bacterium]